MENTTTNKKRGSLSIDGVVYEATDDMLNSLQRQMAFNDTSANTAGLINALKSGEDVSYDSGSNVITGVIKWPAVDDKTAEGRKAGQPRWKRILNSTKNNDSAQFNRWLAGLSGFTYGGPKDKVADDLRKLSGDNLHFVYSVNDDGTKTYLADDPMNIAIDKRLSDWRDYFRADETGRKGYNITDWTPNGDKQAVDALQALYDKYNIVGEDGKNAYDTKIEDIKTRYKNGTLSADDWAFLKTFRILENDDPATLQAEADAETKRKLDVLRGTWTTAGYGDYFDPLHDYYDLDGDSLKLKAGVSSPYANLRNMYFNDDYYKTPEAATGEYDALKGLTFYNGRFYNINSPTLAKIVNSENGFNAQRRAGNWNAAENIIATMHTTDPLGAPAGMPANRYSSFFAKNPRYFYSPNTGYQWLADPTNVYDANGNRITVDDTMQVVRYYDMNSPTSDGPYTTYANKYALLDEHGNFIADLDGSAVINLEETDPRYNKERGFGAYERVVSDNPYFNGRWIEDLVAYDRNNSGISLYHSSTDPDDVLLYLQDFYGTTAVGTFAKRNGYQNVALKLPSALLQAIRNNPNLWKNLKDRKLLDQFQILLSRLFTGTEANQIPGEYTRKMKRLGFSDQDIRNVLEWFHSHNRQERMKYVIPNVPPREATMAARETAIPEEVPEETEETESLKNGGVLKFRYGGSNEQKAVSATYTGADTYESTKNSANLLNGEFFTTRADRIEFAAMLADIASLGTAMGGATPIAAGLGVAGSTARFAADKQRGEKGAGGRYLLDLGMDAATAIPGLGWLAKLKKVQQYAPYLMRLAAAWGMGSAVVNSIKQLESGRFTWRDADIIANGFSGYLGLKQMGLKNGVKKVSKVGNVEIQGKTPVRNQEAITVKGKTDATPEVVLAKEDLVNVKTKEDLITALQTKTKSGETTLEPNKIRELYNIDEAAGKLVPESPTPSKITLTEAELKGAKSQEDLEKVFLRKAKEADSSITDLASAKAKYDFDTVLKKGSRWHPGWKPKDWSRSKEKTSWTPDVTKTTEARPATGNKFVDWFNGTGPRQEAFRGRLNGEKYKVGEEPTVPANPGAEPTSPAEVKPRNKKQVSDPGNRPETPIFKEESKLGRKKVRSDFKTDKEYKQYVKDRDAEYRALVRYENQKSSFDWAQKEQSRVNKLNEKNQQEYASKKSAWEEQRKSFEDKQKEHATWENNKRLAKYNRWYITRPFGWGNLDSNRGNYEIDDSYVAYNPYRTYNPMVAYDKKGGKIEKAQYGSDIGKTLLEQSKKPQTLQSVIKNDFTSTTPSTIYNKMEDASIRNTNKYLGSYGGKNTKPFDYRTFGTGAFNAVNALGRLQDGDKQVEITKSIAPYMQTATQVPQMAMTFSGAGDAYRNAGKQLQSYKAVSADPYVNQSNQLQRDEQKYGNIELNANLADSKEIAANRATNHELWMKQLAAWTEALNNNRYSWWTKRNADATAETQGIAQKSAILNNLGYSAAKDFDDWAANKMMETTYPDYQSDVMRLDNKYRRLLQGMDSKSQEYANLYQQWMAERNATQLYWGLNKSSLKKGGKITYSRDVGPELLLQSNKDTQAFLRKLSENTQRLLLQIRKK